MAYALSLEIHETDIVQACIRQERWAQQRLYEDSFGQLMGVCLRYTGHYDEAMDTLHDGYIKIFRSIHQYQQGTSLMAWMRRIMVNTCIDHYRKQQRTRTEELDSNSYALPSGGPDPLQDLREQDLLKAIQQLSPVYRTIFNLFAIEGYSHREISEQLHITESTSRSNLAKARYKLQEILRRTENENKL